MELIDGVVRNYHWGDPNFIPEWLGIAADGTPYAELWFGAHPSAPSPLPGSGESLQTRIDRDGAVILGPRHTHFPILAKILASAAPLSLQLHPTATQAREGFARENRAGVALDAADRTYRDDSAKPELVCALTPFTAKCGLRPVAGTRELLAVLGVAELAPIVGLLDDDGTDEAARLRAVIDHLFALPEPRVATLVEAVVTAAAQRVEQTGDFNAELEWTGRLAAAYPGDVGVVVALLLNHVVLAPGEALFLDAGNMHSYLDGVAVEVMSPSDNVVRGGLTSKHIDVEELRALLDCRPLRPQVQRPGSVDHAYDVGDDVFGLRRIELREGTAATVEGPGVLIITDADVGATALSGDQPTMSGSRGQAILVCAADGPTKLTGSGTVHYAHGT